jgi:hypothetical protein
MAILKRPIRECLPLQEEFINHGSSTLPPRRRGSGDRDAFDQGRARRSEVRQGDAIMGETIRCVCQSTTHGHRPGKCVSAPTETDGMCKYCHTKALADAAKDSAKAIDPLNQPRSVR